jgi:hypothetical protein
VSNAAEIIGKVQPDLSVKVLQAMDFGSGFGEDVFFDSVARFTLLARLPPRSSARTCFSLPPLLAPSSARSYRALFCVRPTLLLPPRPWSEANVLLCSIPILTTSATDYAAANAVVDATHRYKEIFYEPAGES